MSKWIGKEVYDEEKPCFDGYHFSFGQDDDPMECDESDPPACRYLADGGTWETCDLGALCSWYTDGTPPQKKGA